jgi:hypothetical protein
VLRRIQRNRNRGRQNREGCKYIVRLSANVQDCVRANIMRVVGGVKARQSEFKMLRQLSDVRCSSAGRASSISKFQKSTLKLCVRPRVSSLPEHAAQKRWVYFLTQWRTRYDFGGRQTRSTVSDGHGWLRSRSYRDLWGRLDNVRT